MLYSEMSSRLEHKICWVALEQGEIYSLIRQSLSADSKWSGHKIRIKGQKYKWRQKV